MANEVLDVHHLRRRWKPHKDRLLGQRPNHPTQIRFHRACSWLSMIDHGADEDWGIMCYPPVTQNSLSSHGNPASPSIAAKDG